MTGIKLTNSHRKAWIIPGLLLVCAFFGAGVFPAVADDVSNRIERLENEVQTLSRAVFKGEQPPPGALDAGSGGADQANLGNRMDQLESQLRDLTGKYEDQAHQVDQLKAQLEKMSGDVDMRFNDLKGGGATPPAAASHYMAPPPQPNATSTLQPQDNAQPYKWSSKGAADQSAAAESGSTLGTLNGSAATNDAGAIAYEAAFSQLKSGQYDAAEKGFKDFLAQYPSHSLTGNAKYWLGESYYARAQYDKASRTFAEAYQDNPKGPKAADNLLKLGMSLNGMGKKADACVAMGQIKKEFSGLDGAVLRRAQEEMTKIGC